MILAEARVFHRLGKRRRISGKSGEAPSVPETDNRWISDGGPSDKNAVVARDGRGRFQTGTIANPTGLYRQGQSGNPKGRPRGKFRSGTRAAAALLDAQAEALMQQAIALALGGDPVSVRFCLGRVLGVRRGQPVELALPAVAEPGDLAGAVTAIAAALNDGNITPDEALSLSQMLDGFPRALSAAGAGARTEVDAEELREELMRRLDRLAGDQELESSADARQGDPDRDIAERGEQHRARAD